MIVGAEHCDNEICFIAIKLRQIESEIIPGKLGLMKFVVENRGLGKAGSEQVGDAFHEGAFFPCEGERDAKAFRAHKKTKAPVS